MQYILNETEYQAYLQMKETANLKTIANMALEEEVKNLEKRREADRNEILANRERRKELRERLETTQAALKNSREHVALCNKKLAEQAHELLVKEAELAELSGKLREVKRDMEGSKNERLQLLSEKYDLLAQRDQLKRELAAFQGLQAELEHAVKISEMRLDLIKSLQHTVQTLKSTPVQVVRNPRTDTTKVVTIDVVHNYLQHGWVPLTGELLVGRPA